MNRSRLSRKIEQQSKKNLIFSILGIVVVFFILVKFGIPLLINFTFFISGFGNYNSQIKEDTKSFVSPPVLNPMPSATSSANVVISGVASPNQMIELYINDNLLNKIETLENGSFTFEEIIKEGENIIRTRAIDGKQKSDYSKSITVYLRKKQPSLSVISPTDGQTFSKEQNVIDVLGQSDPDIKVTVNGFWAITDGNGNFSYRLPLQNGENIIKIVAEDQALNKTEKEFKVTYNP